MPNGNERKLNIVLRTTAGRLSGILNPPGLIPVARPGLGKITDQVV
jgi:hypothetical protein